MVGLTEFSNNKISGHLELGPQKSDRNNGVVVWRGSTELKCMSHRKTTLLEQFLYCVTTTSHTADFLYQKGDIDTTHRTFSGYKLARSFSLVTQISKCVDNKRYIKLNVYQVHVTFNLFPLRLSYFILLYFFFFH